MKSPISIIAWVLIALLIYAMAAHAATPVTVNLNARNALGATKTGSAVVTSLNYNGSVVSLQYQTDQLFCSAF